MPRFLVDFENYAGGFVVAETGFAGRDSVVADRERIEDVVAMRVRDGGAGEGCGGFVVEPGYDVTLDVTLKEAGFFRR